MKLTNLALIMAGLIFLPQVAMACPVCFAGIEGDSRVAFIVTTAFLTFLPLTLLGGTVWWFWRRSGAREDRSRAEVKAPSTLRGSSSPQREPISRRSSAA